MAMAITDVLHQCAKTAQKGYFKSRIAKTTTTGPNGTAVVEYEFVVAKDRTVVFEGKTPASLREDESVIVRGDNPKSGILKSGSLSFRTSSEEILTTSNQVDRIRLR